MTPAPLARNAIPFYYPGAACGCLLLHGLTAAPQEMRWLGQHLHGQGYSVYGPLLAGHGASPRELDRSRWQDWLHSARAAYALLRHNCDSVILIGFSMGGALALSLAPEVDARAVVAIATPVVTEGWMASLLPLIGLIPGLMLKKTTPPPADAARRTWIREEQARRGDEPTGHVAFPVWPLHSLRELQLLLAVMRAGLPRIKVPALLIHSEDDQAAPPRSADLIAARLGSTQIECQIYPARGHLITEAPGYEEVYARISAFVGQHAPLGRP